MLLSLFGRSGKPLYTYCSNTKTEDIFLSHLFASSERGDFEAMYRSCIELITRRNITTKKKKGESDVESEQRNSLSML